MMTGPRHRAVACHAESCSRLRKGQVTHPVDKAHRVGARVLGVPATTEPPDTRATGRAVPRFITGEAACGNSMRNARATELIYQQCLSYSTKDLTPCLLLFRRALVRGGDGRLHPHDGPRERPSVRVDSRRFDAPNASRLSKARAASVGASA
jgi:hypothetical protein